MSVSQMLPSGGLCKESSAGVPWLQGWWPVCGDFCCVDVLVTFGSGRPDLQTGRWAYGSGL